MDKRKIEKTSALLISVLIIGLSFLDIDDWTSVGIYSGCHWHNRLIYPFIHVGIIHALMNAWCFLCLIFIYDISKVRILSAFFISALIPIDTLSVFIPSMSTPTVGLSSVIFILFGSISFEVKRILYYQSWMLVYLAIGFILPGTNAFIHLYCYLVGIVIALLNKPIKRNSL